MRDGYEVIEFDVDGAALKAFRFNDAAVGAIRHGVSADPGQQRSATMFPPAPRGAGLAVAHIDRAVQLSLTLKRHEQLDQIRTDGQPVTLNRADITKGYVVDVWNDHDNAWHTLCARNGTYHFLNTNKTIKITDEASTRMAGTSTGTTPDDDFYLHEIVFRWDGWSLAAPRPGKAIVNGCPDGHQVCDSASTATDDFPVQTAFTPVPGSLPRMRYGTKYRFRLRSVDLGGNAVPLSASATDFTGTGATDEVTYGRFEPVAAPVVLPRLPRTSGESPERLVIRSNYNSAANADCERHVAPAKVAELMAEQHGLWDAASGKPKSTDYKLIATHESGSYDASGVLDPNGGGTRYYDTDNPGVPYIPDPIARGATLQNVPGHSGLLQVPFVAPKSTGSAPQSPFANGYSFRLVVIEGAGAPAFDPKRRVLTVQLPKATFTKVKLSSYLSPADIELLGIWNWFTDSLSATDQAAQRQLIVNGQQFAVTPYRELTLVHAVRQPLTAPSFTGLSAARSDLGQTDVTFAGVVNFDRASTQKLDIVGSWEEYHDVPSGVAGAQPTDSPFAIVASSARAFELVTDLGASAGDHEDLGAQAPLLRHHFGDTKHRMVSYDAIATTRFQDYFVQTVQATLPGPATSAPPGQAGAPVTVSSAGIVEQSDVVRNVSTDPKVDATITYTRGVDYQVDYASGTVSALAPLSGHQVHVAFVVPPVTRSSAERPAATVLDIPSSARPAAPRVLYAVPTFGWSDSTTTTGQTSTRKGNGLRVYLDRPWWSTGQDERARRPHPAGERRRATVGRATAVCDGVGS